MKREPDPGHFPAEYFINRELSLLKFQQRVLAQAADERVPPAAAGGGLGAGAAGRGPPP